MNYADEIKQHVTTADACRAYGIHINAAGFASCPFHREKTASMKIYPGDRGFNCFGCGMHGDVIDLVAGLYGLDFLEAVNKLNNDFAVGLPIGRKVGRYRQMRMNASAREKIKAREAYNSKLDALEHEHDYALDVCVFYEKLVDRYKPKDPAETPDARYLWASSHLPEAIAELDAASLALYQHEQSRDH
jgi:DNA primase